MAKTAKIDLQSIYLRLQRIRDGNTLALITLVEVQSPVGVVHEARLLVARPDRKAVERWEMFDVVLSTNKGRDVAHTKTIRIADVLKVHYEPDSGAIYEAGAKGMDLKAPLVTDQQRRSAFLYEYSKNLFTD